MKRIVEGASAMGYGGGLKLRLRGKGSGYKEGPNKVESPDPLHLCLSSSDHYVYSQGCFLVEDLLLQLYGDYAVHSERKGVRKMYQVSRIENLLAGFMYPSY